ncbi:hypothetical protein BpHYR1_049772 [Brachionus plicatilis]|uniref:Uncharacterized protein n=1 Tax=Brachionus plicatilis TaxID=10195 RepID=A0A3M7Q0X9_BRAPC|nr:hypothetical protein BpHYR1_049772 [Brachionus plicatilis]
MRFFYKSSKLLIVYQSKDRFFRFFTKRQFWRCIEIKNTENNDTNLNIFIKYDIHCVNKIGILTHYVPISHFRFLNLFRIRILIIRLLLIHYRDLDK